jgi:hypothetical protein
MDASNHDSRLNGRAGLEEAERGDAIGRHGRRGRDLDEDWRAAQTSEPVPRRTIALSPRYLSNAAQLAVLGARMPP